MTTWFTESPWILILTGLFASGVCLSLYASTRQRKVLIAAGICLVLAVIPFITAILIETPREGLMRTVREMANCVRQNDVEGLLDYVDPEATDVYRRIEREMPTYEFSMCNVVGFESIEPVAGQPETFEVRFNVFVNVSAPRYGHDGMAPRGVKLVFRKDAATERWQVTDFDHYPSRLISSAL